MTIYGPSQYMAQYRTCISTYKTCQPIYWNTCGCLTGMGIYGTVTFADGRTGIGERDRFVIIEFERRTGHSYVLAYRVVVLHRSWSTGEEKIIARGIRADLFELTFPSYLFVWALEACFLKNLRTDYLSKLVHTRKLCFSPSQTQRGSRSGLPF